MKGLGVWRFGRLAVGAFVCWGVWALRTSSAWAACGVAPERCDDFFWENDKVGFRAYGPRDPHLWSGIDVFNKGHVEDEVVKLLRGKEACGAWHSLATLKGGVRTFDNYTMGASRGVGGVAFFDGDAGDNPETREARQWINAIINDKNPTVLPEQAYTVTRILEGIYESAKTGTVYNF